MDQATLREQRRYLLTALGVSRSGGRRLHRRWATGDALPESAEELSFAENCALRLELRIPWLGTLSLLQLVMGFAWALLAIVAGRRDAESQLQLFYVGFALLQAFQGLLGLFGVRSMRRGLFGVRRVLDSSRRPSPG